MSCILIESIKEFSSRSWDPSLEAALIERSFLNPPSDILNDLFGYGGACIVSYSRKFVFASLFAPSWKEILPGFICGLFTGGTCSFVSKGLCGFRSNLNFSFYSSITYSSFFSCKAFYLFSSKLTASFYSSAAVFSHFLSGVKVNAFM